MILLMSAVSLEIIQNTDFDMAREAYDNDNAWGSCSTSDARASLQI